MLNVIAVRKKFKCADNLRNHINTLTQKVPKNVYQSRQTAVAHIVCSVAAAMLTLFTAHTHTPQLPSLASHHIRTDTAAISENTRLSRSHVSMITVCYTQVGELQIFTLEVGNSCVCVHFPALPVGASCI